MDVYFRSSATSLSRILYCVCGDHLCAATFAHPCFCHSFIQPLPDFFVHSALSSRRESHALTLEVIDQDRRDAKPFRHGRLSTAPRRLLPFGFQAIFPVLLALSAQ